MFIIDDDNVIDKNAIRKLVEFMGKHPNVGVAGPIMYFLNDPTRIWCASVKRSCWATVTRFIGFNTIDNEQYREPYESEDFPNAFMVRREVFEKVSLFNSKLFPIHYDEGVLLTCRIGKSGSIKNAIPYTRGDYIVLLDADIPVNPATIYRAVLLARKLGIDL